MFMFSQINSARRRELLKITGFSEGRFLITYLENPIYPSRLTAAHMLELLVKKICNKVVAN